MAITKQIQTLRDRFYDCYDLQSEAVRDAVYNRVFAEHAGESRYMQTAHAYAAFLAEKPLMLHDYDMLVGSLQSYRLTVSIPSGRGPFVPNEHPEIIRSTNRTNWEGVRMEADNCIPLIEDITEADKTLLYDFAEGVESGIFSHTPLGHVVSGFNNAAKIGFAEYERRIEQALQQDRPAEQEDYLESLRITIQGTRNYCRRYSRAARELAGQTKDANKIANLNRIADACAALAERAPQTFFEGVQQLVLLQEMIGYENVGSMSFGRVDQILYPLYQNISYEEAEEIIYAFIIKVAARVTGYQNLVLLGCDEQGNYAGNAVSTMILNAVRDLKYDQPLLCIRYTKDIPEDTWNTVLDIIGNGGGFPAMFNDEVIIPAKIKSGVDPEDVWDYSAVGCVENTIGGKEFSNTEQLRLNWLKVLEFVLNDGYCPVRERNYPLSRHVPLEEITSFEQLKERFKEELAYYIDFGTRACNLIDSVFHKYYPSQMLSITIDDCIGRGEDVGLRGAKYCYSTFNNVGMANVVDSLMAIEKIVFEDKRVTLPELAEILRNNFEGQDLLRAYATHKCQKFGNDLDAPDALMKELVDFACTRQNATPNSRGAHFNAGMYSVDHHARMGTRTGASADGRLSGVALANGFAPCQGADQDSPTAVVNSMTKMDHTMFVNGMVLDLKFNASFLQDQLHRQMFHGLVETYFEQGGMEIQFNVVDRETLLDAQKHPENYPNLVVRVSGFSAYFVLLYKELQDDIIARTQYGSV